MNLYSEDALIEQPAIALLGKLGWETANCFEETFGSAGMLGRETSGEVILFFRLRSALAKLNPELPPEALELAIQELSRERSLMSMVNANREIYKLLKDGVKVRFRNREGLEIDETVNVIDWNEPANNDLFLASQFWVTGEMYKRRTDLIGFVNGIPLLFIELKASHKRLKNAFNDNLRECFLSGRVRWENDQTHPNLPDRPQVYRMAADGGLFSSPSSGTSAEMGNVANPKCDPVCRPNGLPVANAADQSAALANRLRLLSALEEERLVGAHQ
jgi:hypothetical protein